MNKFRCSFVGCNAHVTAHYVQAEDRRVVARGHLCEEHGSRCLYGYFESDSVGAGTPFRTEHGVAFDPGLVFFHEGRDERGPLTQLTLVEVGGSRRLGMGVGRFEGESLALELQHYKAQRPPPHRAMVAVIQTLGGQLLKVVVDRFAPAYEVLYQGKLHIQQESMVVVVDADPCDATTLAVICGVPIFVSEAVLATLPER